MPGVQVVENTAAVGVDKMMGRDLEKYTRSSTQCVKSEDWRWYFSCISEDHRHDSIQMNDDDGHQSSTQLNALPTHTLKMSRICL